MTEVGLSERKKQYFRKLEYFIKIRMIFNGSFSRNMGYLWMTISKK